MRKTTTALDKLILLCRELQKTSAIYCETLGLKIVLQSPQLVQLKDANNLHIYLKSTKKPFQLPKGYSPILSFKVQHFDEVHQKLLRCQLIQDGQVISTELGKIVNFLGPEGQHISINNFVLETEDIGIQSKTQTAEQDKSMQQIKNLLNKIKI